MPIDYNNNPIQRFTEVTQTVSISSGVLTLNLDNATTFLVARNANITTLTISNPNSSGTAHSFSLIFTANGTAYSMNWPTSVKWPSGSVPTLTSANGKKDILHFTTVDGGTNWYGFVGGLNY
jgi:hypothetical protein